MGIGDLFLGIAIGGVSVYAAMTLLGIRRDSQNLRVVLQAADFAARKHKDQRRKDPDQTPYINHPVGVAWSLLKEGKVMDVNCLAAALLHDTVEDTDTTLDELTSSFGPTISSIVDEVSDDKSLPKAERKRLRVLHAAEKTPSAKVVKLADMLYNLRDLQRCIPESWSIERAREYFDWQEQVFERTKGHNLELETALRSVFAKRV